MRLPASVARRISRGLPRRLWRARKYVGHLVRTLAGRGTREKRPLFIFGSQRSGTKMLLRTLDRSMETWVYPEYNRRAFDAEYRIRSFDRLEELVRSCRAPVVAFKPICDSHLADCFLERFKERKARALWIYRNHHDVVNSAVEKWGDHFVWVMEAIADGRSEEAGWRSERLSPERTEEIRGWTRDGLSAEDGAAAFWYLRNRFFFDLGLDGDPRVSLVRYEDVVRDAEDYLPEVFRFAGVDFQPEFCDRIHAGSVGRREKPDLSASVLSACETLHSELDRAHERHLTKRRDLTGTHARRDVEAPRDGGGRPRGGET